MRDLRSKTILGVLWSFVDKAGSQFVGFIITILLARLLTPTEFGIVAMASVFFSISRIFIDSGLRDSLIQKKEADQIDYDTIFYFNIVMGLVIYGIIFFTAPLIASFYRNDALIPIIRVLAINVIFHSFSLVQTAKMNKELRFKEFAKIRIPAVIISGILGLTLAYAGFGVWAIVIQMMTESALFNMLVWVISKWRPTLEFSKNVLDFHWRHGSRLLLGEAITAIYRNIFSLVIGRVFSPAQLGTYNRADSFIVVTYNNTVGLVQAVSYPAMVHVKDDEERLLSSYRRILQFTLLGTLPFYLFLMLQAEGLIRFLLTDKWLGAAPVLVVLSTAAVFAPFNSINLNILKIKRRTDLFLRLQLISKAIFIAIVIVMAQLGFEYLIYTNLFGAVLSLFINNYFANKLIKYSMRSQINDMAPLMLAFVITLVLVAFWVHYVHLSWFLGLQLFANGFIILLMFTGVIFVIRKSLIVDALDMVRRLFQRPAIA